MPAWDVNSYSITEIIILFRIVHSFFLYQLSMNVLVLCTSRGYRSFPLSRQLPSDPSLDRGGSKTN